MESNVQDTSDKITFTISKTALILIATFLALGMGLGAGYFLLGRGARPVAFVASSPTPVELAISPTATPTRAPTLRARQSSIGASTTHTAQPVTPIKAATPQPTQSTASVPAAYLAQPAAAEEMFSEFICPCCGKPIGDCNCGMASERKGFVTGQVSAGKNKLDIYLAYADQYGLDSFVSQEVKREVREYKLTNAPVERPQIVLEPQTIDLGEVSARQGKVETSITIKNTGQKDLTVDGLSTSCGCTMASVVNKGQEGPLFGAGTPSRGWSTTIRPGETGELKIYYDPNFHGEARGPMVREIYISSNDPVDPVVKARIELTQVD